MFLYSLPAEGIAQIKGVSFYVKIWITGVASISGL